VAKMSNTHTVSTSYMMYTAYNASSSLPTFVRLALVWTPFVKPNQNKRAFQWIADPSERRRGECTG